MAEEKEKLGSEVPTNEGWWCNVEKVDVLKKVDIAATAHAQSYSLRPAK